MSNRIRKYRKESSETTVLRRYSLFRVLSSSHSLIIPSYYNYAIRSIPSYYISESNSGRCKVYILANRISYDILGMTEKQLINFTTQYIRLEDEV